MSSLTGNILVTGSSVGDRYLDQLRAAGLDVVNPAGSLPPAVLDEAELTSTLSNCSGYLIGGDEFANRSVLEAAAGSLKIAAFLGVGFESFIDAAAARDLGIAVTNTPGTLVTSVAEMTVGLLLDARRRLADYGDAFGTDRESEVEKQRDIGGHPVGIVGLGAIGTRLAELLTLGFGADVRYFSRTRKVAEEERLGITYQTLESLAEEVESLIVMTPGNPETEGLIGSDVLSRDRSEPMILINTARPEVVDPTALLEAMKADRIGQVRMDHFYAAEVPERAELLAFGPSRIRVTPHIGSLTHDARDAMAQMSVDSILNVLRTGTDPRVVN